MPHYKAVIPPKKSPNYITKEEYCKSDRSHYIWNKKLLSDQMQSATCVKVPTLEDEKIYETVQKFLTEKKKYKNYSTYFSIADIFQYRLESIFEHERQAQGRRPYTGGRLTGSETLKECHVCNGRGETICKHCTKGMLPCYPCHTVGLKRSYGKYGTHFSTCHSCGGLGQAVCYYCQRSYKKRCTNCKGRGKLVEYQYTHTETTTILSHYFTNHKIPQQFLRRCGAIPVCWNTSFGFAVKPICPTECNNKEILLASKQLVKQHRRVHSEYGSCLYKQTQVVNLIPAYKVVFEKPRLRRSFSRNSQETLKRKVFWIIGTKSRVYSPDYGCS